MIELASSVWKADRGTLLTSAESCLPSSAAMSTDCSCPLESTKIRSLGHAWVTPGGCSARYSSPWSSVNHGLTSFATSSHAAAGSPKAECRCSVG